jgi:hypothetical protein
LTTKRQRNVPAEAYQELTEKDVWDVIEFAKAMGGMSYLTPDLVNARMRDATLNPMQATQDTLEAALLNPKNSEATIQAFSQNFELTSMPYKRLMGYLGNMLAWDITYTSTNVKKEDFGTSRYEKDLVITEAFLDKLDYKKEFSIAVKEMLRNDAYFCCPRDTGEKLVLQELPSDYCKITGRWDRGFLFSFNMYYFLLPGVDIEMYPKFFKKKYNEIWGSPNTTKSYNPALSPELRAGSSWIYWVDVPVDVGWCFKMTPELATRLPFFTPLFNDLVLQSLMRNLQKNINMSVASRMIMGEVPMLNKETKATVKDSIAISPDLLGKFMALVKSAISESVKFASAPLTNLQGISFPSENAVYDSYLKTSLASSGVNSNLIFSSNIKPNAIETQLSLNVDEQLATALYRQFDDFVDYFINKMTRHFKFACEFEGTEFFTNRNKRFEDSMTLFDKGIVLPQKIAAAMGMKPSVMRKHMQEAQSDDFMSMVTPPAQLMQDAQTESALTIADKTKDNQLEIADKTEETQLKVGAQTAKLAPKPVSTSTGNKGGRPKVKDNKLSDSGASTRGQASNIGRGGKSA